MTEKEKLIDEALAEFQKRMKELDCDYFLAGFPKKDGSTQITRAHICTANMAVLLDSVANHLAGKMGISRESVLVALAKNGTFEVGSEKLS